MKDRRALYAAPASDRLSAIEARAARQIAATPQIQGEQRILPGPHGVRLEAGVMNDCPRLALLPERFALLPGGASRQGQVELLGLVAMGGVVHVGAEQQKTAGQRAAVALTECARPLQLAPAVTIQKQRFDRTRCDLRLGVSAIPGKSCGGGVQR